MDRNGELGGLGVIALVVLVLVVSAAVVSDRQNAVRASGQSATTDAYRQDVVITPRSAELREDGSWRITVAFEPEEGTILERFEVQSVLLRVGSERYSITLDSKLPETPIEDPFVLQFTTVELVPSEWSSPELFLTFEWEWMRGRFEVRGDSVRWVHYELRPGEVLEHGRSASRQSR